MVYCGIVQVHYEASFETAYWLPKYNHNSLQTILQWNLL